MFLDTSPKSSQTKRSIIAAVYIYGLLGTSCALSQAPEGDSEPPAEQSTAMHSVDSTLPEREKISLQAGDGEHRGYYRADSSGKNYGGVLLIPDLNHNPAKQSLINSLRLTLSSNHWHTLALATGDAELETIQQLITAGITYLNQQGVTNIVVLGEGIGAAQLLNSGAALANVSAVILVNASNDNLEENSETLEKLADIKSLIMDAYTHSDYAQQQQAIERKNAAKRLGVNQLQQVTLPAAAVIDQHAENPATKRIRGWLDKNVGS